MVVVKPADQKDGFTGRGAKDFGLPCVAPDSTPPMSTWVFTNWLKV